MYAKLIYEDGDYIKIDSGLRVTVQIGQSIYTPKGKISDSNLQDYIKCENLDQAITLLNVVHKDYYNEMFYSMDKDENGVTVIPFSPETFVCPVKINDMNVKFWVVKTDQNVSKNIIRLSVLCLFYDDNDNRLPEFDTINWLDISNLNIVQFPDGNLIGAYDLANKIIDITILKDAYVLCFQLDFDDYLNDKNSMIKRLKNIYIYGNN